MATSTGNSGDLEIDSLTSVFLQTSIYSLSLLGWLKYFLLSPLETWAIEMAHLDPTEIMGEPYPLDRLTWYADTSTLMMAVVSIPWWEPNVIIKHVESLLVVSVGLLMLFVLCGAHPVHNLRHTLHASIYVAALLLLSATKSGSSSRNNPSSWRQVLGTLLSRQGQSNSLREYISITRIYGTLLVMIPFQILLVLDRGFQVQRWPVSILLGSTIGWVLGSIVGLLAWPWLFDRQRRTTDTPLSNNKAV